MARRQPTVSIPELVMASQREYNVTGRDTVRNRRRPIICPSPSKYNRAAILVDWCQQCQNWNVLDGSVGRLQTKPYLPKCSIPGNVEGMSKKWNYRCGTIILWGGIIIGVRIDFLFPNRFLRRQLYLVTILNPIVHLFERFDAKIFT